MFTAASQTDPASVLLWFGIVCLVILAFATLVNRLLDRSLPSPPRADLRVPARERELLGDDWRDHVAAYFRRVSRRNEIVHDVCHPEEE